MTVNIARPCVAAALLAGAVALSVHITGCNSCSEKPDAEATAEAALDDKGGVALQLKLDDEAQARAVKLLSKMSKGRFSKRVAARKGNGKMYEPAFDRPLKEGAEFVVVESRGDWINVRFSGVGEGWVPREDVVTY